MSVADQLKASLKELQAEMPDPAAWAHLAKSTARQDQILAVALETLVTCHKISGTLMVVAKQVEWIESALGERQTGSATTPTCESTGDGSETRADCK